MNRAETIPEAKAKKPGIIRAFHLRDFTPILPHLDCCFLQVVVLSGVPNEIRTRVAAVKGRCPRPLDDGDRKTSWWR